MGERNRPARPQKHPVPERAAQLAAITRALADEPGLTAYMLRPHVPAPSGQRRAGSLTAPAGPSLTLSLLRELEQAGTVRQEPAPSGTRWYLTVTATCSDCGDTLTVASIEDKRYCRVDAGGRLAAGDPVEYDQDPADGEPPRAETDCRGSGVYDCPCEADGPDGLCDCCRRGDENGSCAFS